MKCFAFVIVVCALLAGGCGILSGSGEESVMITTDPEGATVYLNDHIGMPGVTPLTLKLKRGVHQTITFKKEGFKEHTITITAEHLEAKRIFVKLESKYK